jgi:hypothetical protein
MHPSGIPEGGSTFVNTIVVTVNKRGIFKAIFLGIPGVSGLIC